MQISEDVIHLGLQARWITSSEIFLITAKKASLFYFNFFLGFCFAYACFVSKLLSYITFYYHTLKQKQICAQYLTSVWHLSLSIQV